MANPLEKNKKILVRDKTALLIIDIQEKILDVVSNQKQVVASTIKLIKGFKILNIPIFYTEQYPKGLGTTAAPIAKELEGLSPIQKMSFSCFGAGNLLTRHNDNNVTQIVDAGLASHM